MSTEKNTSANLPIVTAVPSPAEEPPVKAGPGQKVVESPAGTRSVVEEDVVALLKTQGYKEG